MIFIVSNRNIVDGRTDEHLFGDTFNSQGADVLRVAQANYYDGWNLDLLDEAMDDASIDEPTFQVFERLANDDKPCVVFTHGFNQSLQKNLKKCQEIESYGVNVIAFSWPSNPGPNFILRKVKEYKKARKNARRSAFALERFFDKLTRFVELNEGAGQIKTMLVHSLGNFLTQSFVQSPDFEYQTQVFKNILLHQADVDSQDHHLWVNKLAQGSRVLVTINESDDVLDASDVLNPDRLGNTAANLRSSLVRYYDFSSAHGANDSHKLWHEPAMNNDNIKLFFERAFHGKKVLSTGMEYLADKNCFRVS